MARDDRRCSQSLSSLQRTVTVGRRWLVAAEWETWDKCELWDRRWNDARALFSGQLLEDLRFPLQAMEQRREVRYRRMAAVVSSASNREGVAVAGRRWSGYFSMPAR